MYKNNTLCRWLVEHGRISEAKKVLGKIRRNVIDVEQVLL